MMKNIRIGLVSYSDWLKQLDKIEEHFITLHKSTLLVGKAKRRLFQIDDNMHLNNRAYTEQVLCSDINRLKKREVDNLSFHCYFGDGAEEEYVATSILKYHRGIRPFWTLDMTFYCTNFLWGDVPLLAWIKKWGKELQAITGSINNTSLHNHIYEEALPLEGYYKKVGIPIENYFDRKLREYGWVNLLTNRHIAILGGKEKIRRQAPCYAVEDVGTEDMLLLQATQRLEQFGWEQRKSLKEFFSPLLYDANLLDIAGYYPDYQNIGLVYEKGEIDKIEHYKKLSTLDFGNVFIKQLKVDQENIKSLTTKLYGDQR